MRPYFISYRRTPWGPEVLELSTTLRRRGIPTVVDVSDPDRIAGRAQYDELRRIIQQDCAGFVLHMTRNAPESACIWNVEVPAALEAFDRGGYDLVPLFRDTSPSDVQTVEPHGRRLSSLGGFVVSSDDLSAIGAAHAEVANVIVRLAMQRRVPEMAGVPLSLGIRTRRGGTYARDAELLLDWSTDFEQILRGGNRRTELALRNALTDVRGILGSDGPNSIRVSGPAHLSAGLAVGYTFHRASGFQLEVLQRDSVWPADGERSAADVRISAHQLDPASPDVMLAVALSRPELLQDTDAAVGPLGLAIGGRVAVEPEDGAGRESVVSDSHARGIVFAVTNALMRARSQWRTRGTTHIFMACPFGVAVLLGHALNGFGPLALYEPAPTSGYVRVVDLP